MIQGTASNVGKSLIVTGLARILTRKGYRVAPFKAQNMSLNAGTCGEGLEMGRAQILQAAACGLRPDARMNPVLLKPDSEGRSQVVLLGKSQGSYSIHDYHAQRDRWFDAVLESYHDLSKEFDMVLLEGAGSIAEINLRSVDIVNMPLAKELNCPTLLVGNIDPGGVYGALVGCLELLEKEERSLVKGLIVNRFRGDPSLLEPAHEVVASRTGLPFLGVIHHLDGLGLPEEDSVSFSNSKWGNQRPQADLDIVVIDYGYVSNINDLEPLAMEKDVGLRKVKEASELGCPDVVILPGSRNVFRSIDSLEASGLKSAILELKGELLLFGICGGMMILGEEIHDPTKIESSDGKTAEGLGRLPLATELDAKKVLRESSYQWTDLGTCSGYEMHHGRVVAEPDRVIARDEDFQPVAFSSEKSEGVKAVGTWIHGLFDDDAFRRAWLDEVRMNKGLNPVRRTECWSLDVALEQWADHLESALDVDAIIEVMARN